jgi:hypothetical protein
MDRPAARTSDASADVARGGAPPRAPPAAFCAPGLGLLALLLFCAVLAATRPFAASAAAGAARNSALFMGAASFSFGATTPLQPRGGAAAPRACAGPPAPAPLPLGGALLGAPCIAAAATAKCLFLVLPLGAARAARPSAAWAPLLLLLLSSARVSAALSSCPVQVAVDGGGFEAPLIAAGSHATATLSSWGSVSALLGSGAGCASPGCFRSDHPTPPEGAQYLIAHNTSYPDIQQTLALPAGATTLSVFYFYANRLCCNGYIPGGLSIRVFLNGALADSFGVPEVGTWAQRAVVDVPVSGSTVQLRLQVVNSRGDDATVVVDSITAVAGVPVAAGSLCSPSGVSVCLPGSYCSGGVSVPCPAGTARLAFGASSADDCISCPADAYSPAGASSCAFTASTCPVGTFASGAAACAECNANIIPNGDFEMGWSGFSSGYSRCASPSEIGQAGKADVFQAPVVVWCPAIPDHTSGNGKFFVANGDSSANAVVWHTTTTCALKAQQLYRFQAWVITLTYVQPVHPGPNLQFWIAPQDNSLPSVLLGGMPPLSNGCSTTWTYIFADFFSTFDGIARISLVNTETAAAGNDFAVDDIFFGSAFSAPGAPAWTAPSCPAGKYLSGPWCLCAAGFYIPSGSTSCLGCPASYYCASGAPVLCPAGSYCPLSTIYPTPCPAGTWSNAAGAASISACTSCPAGAFSAFSGAVAPSTCTPCAAGTFSASPGANSSSACLPCGAGAYSPAGASSCAYTASTCPVGTYASMPAACTACSPATACTVAGLSAQPPCYWSVSTLAGSGEAGWADGQGTAAAFFDPHGVSVDPVSHVIYVGDLANNRVRRITPSGAVTTFAGSGSAVFANGIGAAAAFNRLTGVSVDWLGNLHVADFSNHRVRTIVASGAVSTLAGCGIAGGSNGVGTFAQFNGPADIAIDASGGTGYIVEFSGHRVRSIVISSAVVSTLAGSGVAGFADGIGTAARFDLPASAVWHPSGTLFVGGHNDNRVRRINIASAAVSTLAGNGVAGGANGMGTAATFNIPRGVALDATFSTLYVVEAAGNRIRSIDVSTALVQTIAGSGAAGYGDSFGTSAVFSRPVFIASASSGALFTAESHNHRIRQLTCMPCPASYYCASGAPVLCPAGSYCPLSTVDAIPCPAGTYSPFEGASACLDCPCPSACAQPGLTTAPSCSVTPSPSGTPTVTPSSSGTPSSTRSGSSAPSVPVAPFVAPTPTPARLPPGSPCAPAGAPSPCAGGACRGGFCCSASAAALGCAACLPGTGSCVHFSPGEPCASAADCGTNLCAGGCCCAATALLAPGCAACACWANASTTAATAGACVAAAGGGVSCGGSCGGTTIIYNINSVVSVGGAPAAAAPRRCPACDAFDAAQQVEGLFILPGGHPLNPSPGVELAVGLPGSCASLAAAAAAQGVPPAEAAVMLPCLAHAAFAVIDGATYEVLGPAAPLRLAALPEGCNE